MEATGLNRKKLGTYRQRLEEVRLIKVDRAKRPQRLMATPELIQRLEQAEKSRKVVEDLIASRSMPEACDPPGQDAGERDAKRDEPEERGHEEVEQEDTEAEQGDEQESAPVVIAAAH